MKKSVYILFAALAFTLTTTTSCGSSNGTNNVERSADSASENTIDFENAFIVDVRTPAEFNGGSFEGAVNIPLNTVGDNIEEFEGKKQVVVFCRSGSRSGQAQRILEQNGITNVINGINQSHLEEVKAKQ